MSLMEFTAVKSAYSNDRIPSSVLSVVSVLDLERYLILKLIAGRQVPDAGPRWSR
jgi:hypothetical protein